MTSSRPDGRESRPSFGWPEYMVMSGALAFVVGSLLVMLFDPRPGADLPGLAELFFQAPAVDDTVSGFGWVFAVLGMLIAAVGIRLSDRY